jgi:eukaryotic-like serine/threonine-protein kinase
MLKPGTKLGRYEIRSALGAGGMGEVYLAHDTRLDRKVALKILPDEIAADPDRMKRFEQEARAASGLNHPNIITIYEIDQSAATHFIAAEFIDGATLRERMRTRPVPLGEVLDVAVQIASGLSAAHANGIVHRDIKPENVILRRDGIAKVLDFGLAKLTGQGSPEWVDSEAPTRVHLKTESGVVMGTACYMSPEQARGLQVDARTDIFSLGVVIYELMTGRLPFEGGSVYEIVAEILGDREALPLSRYSPDMPGELERIVAKTLRKNREERYQTIKDLQLDLQSLRQQLEFERKRDGSRPPVLSPSANKTGAGQPPRLALRKQLLVLGIVVLVGIAIGYLWRREKAPAVSSSEIKSLAVLPLKSLDAGDNYLGLGIADAAIRRISQTGRVIVRPTSAVRRYLNEDTDALTAAKQLGVDSVLEGSFQRAGERLRVSVNLLRSSDGASLWTDSFDLRTADIFAVQDTVSQQVASRLRLQLDTSQQAKLTRQSTSSAIAYEFYLKGVYAFDQRGGANTKALLETTIGFFKQAIEADPNFALAHAQLAYAYATMAVFEDPRQTWVDRANEEIQRAQELDPQLAETHLVRFQLLFSEYEGYQGEAAVREVRLANQLNPNVGHAELAYLYAHLGLEDLAVRELERALEVDPTSEALRKFNLLIYEVGCKYDEYAAHRNSYQDDESESWYFMGQGRLKEAQRTIDGWSAKSPNDMELLPLKTLLYALKGDFRAADAEIPVILSKHPVKDPVYHHAAYGIAEVYALEGKSAEAVRWLREAAASGFQLYPSYQRDPHLNRIRQSADFKQFLAEMKAQNEKYQLEFGQSKRSG